MSGDALHVRPMIDLASGVVFTDHLEAFASVLVCGAPDPAHPSVVTLAARARVEARDAVKAGRAPAGDEAVLYGTLYRLARERAAAVVPSRGAPPSGPRCARALEALGTLRHRQRAALALYYVIGLPMEAVARALGVKERQARSVVESAVSNLVKTFGEPVDIRRALRTAGSRIVAARPEEASLPAPARMPRAVVRSLLAPLAGVEPVAPPPHARRRSPVEALITPAVLRALEDEPADIVPPPVRPLAPPAPRGTAEPRRDILPARRREPFARRLVWAAAVCLLALAALVPAGARDASEPGVPAVSRIEAQPLLQVEAARVPQAVTGPRMVAVLPGDSLWRIAGRELGEPLRWTDVWLLNRGRVFGGSRFVDPDLIEPGWRLRVPRR